MRKLFFAVLLLIIYSGRVQAQLTDSASTVDMFKTYLSKTVRYPALARENDISGQIVAEISVGEDKTVKAITIIKSLKDGSSLDKEVIRSVNSFNAALNIRPGKYTCIFSFAIYDADGKEIHHYEKIKDASKIFPNFLFETVTTSFYNVPKQVVVN